jgi:hypothetical protein
MSDNTFRDIEEELRELTVQPTAALDERVRKLAEKIDGTAPAGEESHAAADPEGWVRRESLTHRRWVPIAATILVAMLGSLAAWHFLNGRGAVAWADVEEALRSVPWVHVVSKDPETGAMLSESWYQTGPRRAYFRSSRAGAAYSVLTDYRTKERWLFDPGQNMVTILQLPVEHGLEGNFLLKILNNDLPAGWPTPTIRRTAPDEGLFEAIFQWPDKPAGPRVVMHIWTEEARQLPVRATIEATSEGGEESHVEEMELDYPSEGPADIYAIGVPRDAKIVDGRPDVDITAVLDEYERRRQAFPKTYSAIVYAEKQKEDEPIYDVDREIYLVYKQGEKLRVEWFVLDQNVVDCLVDASIYDGSCRYRSKSAPGRDGSPGRAFDKVPCKAGTTDYDGRVPEYIGWPIISRVSVRRITSDNPDLAGMIGIEQSYGDNKHQYWLDPQRDYLVHRHLQETSNSTRRDEIQEYGQLSTGNWYPMRKRYERQHITLHVTETSDFLPRTFDEKSLKVISGIRD